MARLGHEMMGEGGAQRGRIDYNMTRSDPQVILL